MSEVVARTPFTNLNPSAAIRGLLEVIAKVIADLYGLVKTIMQQSFVQTATGTWLDLKVREMGIVRRAAIKTKVYLTLSCNAPATQNITIPAGTICKSQKDSSGNDYRFITVEEALLEEGQTSVQVIAEAELPGRDWNVGQDTITRMVTRITEINAVTNSAGYLIREGSNPEADELLRERAADLGEPPSWPCPGDAVKVSAAWLIDRAGFGKGYAGPEGVAISTKHTLALTNHTGTASTAALVTLARRIRDGVEARFGVPLHPEPVLINCTL